MTRYEFDRERLLTELSDFGIGFSEGTPRLVPERRGRVQFGAVAWSVVWAMFLAAMFAWSRVA